MTNDEINIAIANACGQGHHHLRNLPDYLNDLNAMHEAEKILDQMQARAYSDFLGQSEQDGTWAGCHCFHQTAAQRAEAFLKTLNLWTE
jgi:hypothetical protein